MAKTTIRRYGCHQIEVSFFETLTCILIFSQSFTASFRLNKGRCFSTSIDSWGKQWIDSFPQIGRNCGAEPVQTVTETCQLAAAFMGYSLNLMFLICWLIKTCLSYSSLDYGVELGGVSQIFTHSLLIYVNFVVVTLTVGQLFYLQEKNMDIYMVSVLYEYLGFFCPFIISLCPVSLQSGASNLFVGLFVAW